MKINNISPDKHEFLQILQNIAVPPKTLHYIGTLSDSRPPTVAIVGTRKPTAYGRAVTEQLAGDLAGRGVAIVSGLALGIDAIAHQAALEAGGLTVAVLGNGLPEIYPVVHTNLAKKIVVGGGAIISEYPEHEKARPYYFLERNRLVSGLSDAILVTEAAARSGTLNTAMHALEQGKEIFVVPGNITSPMSAGCNALLRQGATLVTSADDILESIAPELLNESDKIVLSRDNNEITIIALIRGGISDGDALLRKSGLDGALFSQTMTMLEINGVIRNLGANQWTIR